MSDNVHQPGKSFQGREQIINGQSEVKRMPAKAQLSRFRFTSLFYHFSHSMNISSFLYLPSDSLGFCFRNLPLLPVRNLTFEPSGGEAVRLGRFVMSNQSFSDKAIEILVLTDEY